MLMIRFQRIGRTNDAAFRIVVLEKERAAKSGGILAQVGTYNPRTKALTLQADALKEYIAQGAQPTPSVKNLLINQKVLEGKKTNPISKTNMEKNKVKEVPAEEAAPAAVVEAAPEAPADAPAEEVVAEAPSA